MSWVLYGIANCDKVRQAKRWLDEHGVQYRFHDLRTDGLTPERLQRWIDGVGVDGLLNKRSTTWRQLSSERSGLESLNPSELMLEFPTLIKRPLLDVGKGQLAIGFNAAEYTRLLND